MANTLENTDLVSSLVIARLFNKAQKIGLVGRETEGDFNTAEFGDTINLRRPVYLASSSGAVIGGADTSNIEEGKVAVVVDQREKVVFELSSKELALNVTSRRAEQYIDAMADELLNKIELSIANEAKLNIWNYTDSTSGATLDAFANAEAFMVAQGVSILADKYGCVTPFVARLLSKEVSTTFSFPSVVRVSEAMERASIGLYSNILFMQDQVLATHTSGVATTTGTILVNGNDQDVTYNAVKDTFEQTLAIDGLTLSVTGIFKAGDVINIATFDAINQKTRESIGELQDYIIKADANSNGSGEATITISPPMIAATGVAAAFNTLDPDVTDVSTMDGKVISVKTGTAGAVRKENLIMCREAFTLAMVDLPSVNEFGADSSTKSIDGLSLRLTKQYSITTDQLIHRCEALWAVEAIQPYYAFRVATSK